jgi:Dit-like phage tail protein
MDDFYSPITILTRIGSITDNVQVDVTKKVVEEYEAQMSSYATETGMPKGDTRIILPNKLNIEGGFKDITISRLFGSELTGGARRKRAKELFDKLLGMFMKEDTFPVMNGLHLIENMHFTYLAAIKDEPKFSIKFQAKLQRMPQFQIDSGGMSQTFATLPQFLAAEALHVGTRVPTEFKDVFGIVG